MGESIYVFGANARGVKRQVIAHHLVFMGYGHWLPNDPRGSGSTEIRQEKLEDFGDVHLGRKQQQPERWVIREFYRHAAARLEHESFWYDDEKRAALVRAVASVITEFGYTAYEFASCGNHSHLVVRRHKDDGEVIWDTIAGGTAEALRRSGLVPDNHPVWADRPYVVYLHTPDEVRGRIKYVSDNPLKEGLPRQSYGFVVPYDGWPFHNRKK